MKVKLKAVKSMRYATRRLEAGDAFEASNNDARILVALKKAEYAGRDPAEIPPIPETLARRVGSVETPESRAGNATATVTTETVAPVDDGKAPATTTEAPAPADTMPEPAVTPVDEEKSKAPAAEDIGAARERYNEIIGRRAYPGWSVEQINEKIAEFQASKK